MFIITPGHVEKEAIAQGISPKELKVPQLAILTFNRGILDELTRICELKEWDWPGAKFSPYYSTYKSWKGTTDTNEVGAFFPPMGASPLVTFCEDLIHYGAKAIFLLCASWGLGRDFLRAGQIHLPSFAVGIDGTTPHYGNKDFRVEYEPGAFKALATALNTIGADWKEGGVGACEAFYRITPDLIDNFRKQGCLSMENGETSALYCLAKERDITVGVLLQPYIDLEQGWKISFMGERYKETCRLQARAAIEALKVL